MLPSRGLRHLRIHRQYSSNIKTKWKPNEFSSMEIRNMFVNYFVQEHDHKFIRSSPVIPFCDPTVPFVNAGMNQFKNIFLGKATPSCSAAANSQKCIRAGGKHNDLSVIGTDGYHHTFFEMLGNWSFGDYFKDKACRMAWDLLTNVYKIDSTRLYVTYFGGDQKMGLQPDLECKEIWQRIGVPLNRIIPFGINENFWEMGATGPCGPCSEIHIDHLPNSDPTQRAPFVNAGRCDLTELWNVVFIEYNRNSDGALEPLKQKFVDTGMGFERLVAVLQGQSSNYDTDLFLPIFDAISKESGAAPYSGVYNSAEANYELDFAYRLVADHVRMSSVCIADGMYPQTNHRLRKVVRKALNICDQRFRTENLIQKAIIPKIVESLGFVYPELEKNSQSVCDVFRYEHELFKVAVENNRKNFKLLKIPATSRIKEEDTVDFSNFSTAYRDVEKQMQSGQILKTLPVEFAFEKLFVTHGLNDDLIQKLADEMKLTVNMDEFQIYKNTKKLQAKSQHQIETSTLLDKAALSNVPATFYHPMYDYVFDEKSCQFTVNPIHATVAIVEYNASDDTHHIVLDKTNFYHIAGGQDSDIGRMVADNGIFEVQSVTIHKDYVVHSGRFLNGIKPFEPNERVTLLVDPSHRTHLSQHHTAVHLLQAAMKKVTNCVVFQESSRVTASNLKCQFGVIGKRVSLDQLQKIEELVCKVIQQNVPIDTQYLAAHELYAMNNLTTVPGATYPDNEIRVLRAKDEANEFESIEPCCGTHASNTNQLEDFRFTSLKVNNSTSYLITAVAGQLVESLKSKETEFLQNFTEFKEKLASIENCKDIDEFEAMESEASQLNLQLSDGQLPYITSARVVSELETFGKQIRIGKRAHIRQLMVAELVDALSNRNHFLVHVLETKTPLDDMLLAEAVQMCNDLPAIVLNVSNNRIVGGRASIPLQYSDGKFDAKHWLTELVRPFKIKCSPAKIKNRSSQSILKEAPNECVIEPLRLQAAIDGTKSLAVKVFSKRVTADENRRLIQAFQLKKDVQDYRSKVNKVQSLDDVVNLVTLLANVRDEIKYGQYPYELKSTCSAELAKINDEIIDAQHKIEMKLYNPALEQAISTATLNNKPCIFHAIATRHPLHNRTILRMTDTCTHLTLVLIVISGDVAIGRISMPTGELERNVTAKELSEEFCLKFNGTIVHHGTRFGSVCDFQLTADLINEASLKEVFQRVEKILSRL